MHGALQRILVLLPLLQRRDVFIQNLKLDL